MPLEFLGVYFWYFLAAFLGFFVYRRTRREEFKEEGKVIVVGHRGASGYAFQNSLPSFKKALEIGVDYVETDIRVSSDGEFVLCHDKAVKTVKGKMEIAKASIKEIKAATLFSGAKILSLEEFVREMPRSQNLYLDLKVMGAEFEFLSFLRKHELIGRSVITSHYASSLRLLKVLEPKLIVGLSFPRERFNTFGRIILSPLIIIASYFIKYTYPFMIGYLLSWARADFLVVQFHVILSRDLVKAAHKRGVMVFAFNVKRRRNIIKLIKWGVDGIISDFPDRVKAAAGRIDEVIALN